MPHPRRIPPYFKHIKPLPILKKSGFIPKYAKIYVAKKHQYTVVRDVAITGDAPKDIIRLYEYGIARKSDIKSWSIYIAKLGHKWYPNESITEQFLTDVGKTLGFNMADSRLCILGGQIRFLSKYFLNIEEKLEHGADLYAAFLQDKSFIDDVEKEKATQDFFTVHFTREVFEAMYPQSASGLFQDFMRLLFFDALVGNNDRHLYNWGVISDIKKQSPRFAPIYDSARALFWNSPEDRLPRNFNKIESYCLGSCPKIGIEKQSKTKINHFDLIARHQEHFRNDFQIITIFESGLLGKVFDLLDDDYKALFSETRRQLIRKVLLWRFQRMKEILRL